MRMNAKHDVLIPSVRHPQNKGALQAPLQALMAEACIHGSNKREVTAHLVFNCSAVRAPWRIHYQQHVLVV